MRNTILLLITVFLFSSTHAQTSGSESACVKINYPLPGKLTTLKLTMEDGTYWGYISGNNLSQDKSKANYFSYDSTHPYVKGAYFEFGVATNKSGLKLNITFGLWKFNDTIPDTAMVSSKIIPIQQIVNDVNNQAETYIEFPTPVKVTGAYLIGVKLPTKKGDTLALKSNTNGDTNPGTAWEQWSDSSWHKYSEPDCWYINISNAVYPLVCSQTTDINKLGIRNYELGIYPNPAKDILNISFGKTDNKNVEIKIFDLTEKCLKSYNVRNLSCSVYNIELKGFQQGLYFVSIVTDNLKTTKKFTIIK